MNCTKPTLVAISNKSYFHNLNLVFLIFLDGFLAVLTVFKFFLSDRHLQVSLGTVQ